MLRTEWRPAVRQPAGGGLRVRGPLAEGLTRCFVSSNPTFDLVRRESVHITPLGPGFELSQAEHGAALSGVLRYEINEDWGGDTTFVALVSVAGFGSQNYAGLFAKLVGVSTTTQATLYRYGTAGSATVASNNSGVNYLLGSDEFVAASPSLLVFRRSGGSFDVCWGGVWYPATTDTSPTGTGALVLGAGRDTAAASTTVSRWFGWRSYSRALSNDEVSALQSNFWDGIEARTWVSGAAAHAGGADDSAPGALLASAAVFTPGAQIAASAAPGGLSQVATSMLAGSASGSSAGNAPGALLSTTAATIAGAAAASSRATGRTWPASAQIIPGGAGATANALAPGASLGIAAALLAEAAVAASTAPGVLLSTAWHLTPGKAVASGALALHASLVGSQLQVHPARRPHLQAGGRPANLQTRRR